MGCSDSRSVTYTVQYCSLEPIDNQENIYKIKFLAEETIEKIDSLKFLNQIGKNNDPIITKFLERPNIKTSTIFYYYLRDEPLIRSFYQSEKYIPYNLPELKKVILLSIDSLPDFPIQIIEKETKHLEESSFINHKLDLNDVKLKLDKANNLNITKDSLSMKENSMVNEEESVKEKPEEIIINDDINGETYEHVMSKLKNGAQGNNGYNNNNLETSVDNNIIKGKNQMNSSNIKSVKIHSCKIENINVFYKIMNLFAENNIRKFSFFDNNINNDFEGWDAISSFLETNYSLRYLDLHSSNLYDHQLSDIVGALVDKRIRFLNLSENFITIDGLEIIASYLKCNKTLQKLNLSRNAQCQFKSEGVKIITEALISNPNIEFLDFSYMNLTGCGEYIGNFITQNKSIECIILRSVLLNAIDFKNIFVPLKSNKVLIEIDISMNDMGGDKSLQYIADAIKENKTLNTLKMDQININNDNYQIIFDAIEKNVKINSYSVNYNSKIKPMIMLNFFIKQKQVKNLEYEPYDKENLENKNKELTLEEKKMFAKFKTERPDMKLVYK